MLTGDDFDDADDDTARRSSPFVNRIALWDVFLIVSFFELLRSN